MRIKIILLGSLISCFLIVFTPSIPAIEYNLYYNKIQSNIIYTPNYQNNLDQRLLKYILDPIIDLIKLILSFIKDLIDIFVAIEITIFDYISQFLIELLNILNEIQKPLLNIVLSFLIGIYILLTFTCLVLIVQFTGIIVIIYQIIEKLILPLIYLMNDNLLSDFS